MRIGESRLSERRARRWDRSFDAFDPVVIELAAVDEVREARVIRIAAALAVAAHLVLLVVVIPSFEPEPVEVRRETRVHRLQQVRFEPPPPEVRRAVPPPRTARRVPIPDPTPHDPEPIQREETEEAQADFPEIGIDPTAVWVPDGPPGPAISALTIAGDVLAPERVFAPQPGYPEAARLGRVQGVVVLQTIIDTLGNVVDVEVLKGLPSGLTEAAVEAVSSWRFRPATLHGEPVPVRYLVTISFSVQ